MVELDLSYFNIVLPFMNGEHLVQIENEIQQLSIGKSNMYHSVTVLLGICWRHNKRNIHKYKIETNM